MTRHKHAHTGLVTPSLPQLLLTATLRLFAMLVLNVASTLQMTRRRPAVNATRQMPATLPREKSDTQSKEPNTVAASDHDDDRPIIITTIALILRDREAIVSKDEGVLTGICREPSGSGPLVRVPREGGDPVLLDKDAREALEPCSSKAEQASSPALDPRLRGGHGREIAPKSAPA